MADLTVSANVDTLMQSSTFAAFRTSLGLTALATTAPGTGVATALAIATGSAGGVILIGSDAGTPSAIVLTNASGTAASLTAGAATVLATARAINGTNFDGSAAITITAAAGTLTGATLNATVLNTSITSTGTLTGGATGAGFTLALTTSTLTGSLPAAQMPALTGDITTAAGAVATTLATVNGNVGAFGSSTSIPNFTVNAKGLITVAGTNVVVAPAGTLSGATLASGVTASSLTSVGTLTAVTVGTGGATLLQGTSTLTCGARGSGTAAYLTVNTPGDNNITASTESIGVNFAAGTRTWATGALTTQREHVFAANTLTFNGSSTCTTAVNVEILNPIAGANATITNKYALRTESLNVTGNSVLGGSLTSNSGGIITNANFTCGGTNGLIASGQASFYCSGSTGVWILDNSSFTGAGGRVCWGTSTNSSPAISRVAVNGLEIKSSAGTDTYNDASTANSGTVANRYIFGFPAPTLTSTGTGVTDTIASTVYIGGAPTASTNTTITTPYALNVAAGSSNFGGPVILPRYTVASLPSTAATGQVQGATAVVTDLLTPTFLTAAVGGGATVGTVLYNGTAWVSN